MSDSTLSAEVVGEFLDHIEQGYAAVEITDDNRETVHAELEVLRGIVKRFAAVADDLEHRVCQSLPRLPRGQYATLNGKRYYVGRKRRYRDWQSDDLLRAVLDSRRANADGEPIDETPFDKVRDVYAGLPGYHATRTKLEARGIDPTEFCQVESGRLELREPR
jgi:hypothetical protein